MFSQVQIALEIWAYFQLLLHFRQCVAAHFQEEFCHDSYAVVIGFLVLRYEHVSALARTMGAAAIGPKQEHVNMWDSKKDS